MTRRRGSSRASRPLPATRRPPTSSAERSPKANQSEATEWIAFPEVSSGARIRSRTGSEAAAMGFGAQTQGPFEVTEPEVGLDSARSTH
jgi:hypothetical protein